MRKLVFLSLVTAVALSAKVIPSNVLEASSLSVENGGTKTAIDAYSDGGGSIVIGDSATASKPIDNSPMNELVFKYGENAKLDGTSLVNEVKNLNPNATVSDKLLADRLIPDGTSCNDNNIQTINDVIVDSVCIGTNVEGLTCNDNNLATINDKYHNGICVGVNVDGTPCDDGNAQTTNDVYKNGVCIGDLNCDDGLQSTVDIAVNGACQHLPSNCTNGFPNTYSSDILCHMKGLTDISQFQTLKTFKGSNLYLYGNSFTDLSPLNNLTMPNGSALFVDSKTYTVKLSASSPICQNSTIYIRNGDAQSLSKSIICNP